MYPFGTPGAADRIHGAASQREPESDGSEIHCVLCGLGRQSETGDAVTKSKSLKKKQDS